MATVQTTAAAVRANNFVSTLGINTHIDFADYGYQNLSVVEASINYLGVINIRDSAELAADARTWLQVSQATHAKFDDYIAETSPAGMTADLGFVRQLAAEGILNFIEGGNEEDDFFPTLLGNNLQITALFQQQVYVTGESLGLPVINMSFGSGWTPDNNYQGNYGAVGNLAAYAGFGNAHTYPNVGQSTDWAMQRLNGLARMADSTDPVITTEIGWNESQGFGQANIAKYVLQAALDGMKDGDAKTYFYGLFDDGSGLFGLMNQDGTPKPAGIALHNLTTLLADTSATASTFTPGTLGYTLSGTTASDNSLLMEKSDGSFWISLWDENDVAHDVTLTLGAAASEIKSFSPLTGITAVRDLKGVASVTVSVSDNPLILEVIPAIQAIVTRPAAAPPTPTDLKVIVPATQTLAAGSRLAVTGASISDPWAAAASGSMTLNVWDTAGGTITMAGQAATSAGWISVTGTLSQLNTDLAGLAYTSGGAGADAITVDVWNQAGVEAQQTIAVTVRAGASAVVAPAPAATVVPAVTIAATELKPGGVGQQCEDQRRGREPYAFHWWDARCGNADRRD